MKVEEEAQMRGERGTVVLQASHRRKFLVLGDVHM